MTWKQERPPWCPSPACQFLLHTQQAACVGRLPQPVEHDGDFNTHRLCIHGADDDGNWLSPLMINSSDAYNLTRLLTRVREDAASTTAPPDEKTPPDPGSARMPSEPPGK